MNANPRACIEPRMSHGQVYNADKLAKVMYQDLGRFHLSARVVHAKDRIYAGKFITTPAAQTLSHAANFQGNAVPVTMGLSAVSGDPEATSTVTVAMATQFHLPNGTLIDSTGIILPAFYSASSVARRKCSIRPPHLYSRGRGRPSAPGQGNRQNSDRHTIARVQACRG